MWLDDLRRDISYALRTAARHPGFTGAAVVTLALGIGATTAIFSVVHALLLKGLPYTTHDSDRLVRVMAHLPGSGSQPPRRVPAAVNAAEAAEVQARSRTLVYAGTVAPTLMGIAGPEGAARLQGARASPSVFPMLGATPLIGRAFSPDESQSGADRVLLLSHPAWHRFFGADPGILGRKVALDSVLGRRTRTEYVVVGVMPPSFTFPTSQTQFWLPLTTSGESAVMRGALIGRLADGVTPAAALSELDPILRAVRDQAPAIRYELVREQDEIAAPVRPALTVLMAAVGVVLLIACANVANLLLARTAGRRREIAVRAALGAGRSRLAREALTESAILAVLGGAAGVALAVASVRLLRALAAHIGRLDLSTGAALPRLDEVAIDLPVLAFTAAASIATGILFGLAPALRQSRSDPMEAFRAAPPEGDWAGRLRAFGSRGTLVIAQTTLATMLLIGAALLVHSFIRLAAVDPGYDPQRALTFQVALPVDASPDARLRSFAEDLVARLRTMPGVHAAAYANQLPMVQLRDTAGGLWAAADPGRRPAPDAADARFVSREYFTAMGIRVVAGRGFEERDAGGRPRVLLVNEALASRDLGGNAVGRTVYVGRDPAPWEIVGVVEDVRQFALDRAAEPQFFVDLRQWSGGPLFPVGAYYVVRTEDDPAALVPVVRAMVRQLDAQAALFNVAPMEQLVAATLARPRLYAALLAIFAGLAAALAAVGIYGVLAYAVSEQTREIGIRIAVGAPRSRVVLFVVRSGLVLAVSGIALGTLGAAWMTQYLEGMLFGVASLDRATFAAVALLFGAVAAIAAYVPARRAAAIDPVVALRCE